MGDVRLAQQLRHMGVADERVLHAIASLERRHFVPEAFARKAELDGPLPIGFGQTISQPYVVARMTELLELVPGQRVLEVGTGSGYQAAVLAQMGLEVYSLEIVPELARRARIRLEALGLSVHLREGNGYFGWAEEAPFDGVLLTAAPTEVPDLLVHALKVRGHLVAPVGEANDTQELRRYTLRSAQGPIDVETIFPVRFVPMTGGGY